VDNSLQVGDTLKGRYLIHTKMRPGGFGKVYLALDTQLQNRKVVIKTMEGDQVNVDLAWAEEHFKDEIKALVRVHHPGVVGVLDIGETLTGVPYFIMPYVAGENLRAAMSTGKMKLLRASKIIQQLSLALSAAHQEGITHRDIKPENVLLQSFKSGQENVVLIDFGISSFRDLQKGGPVNLTRVAGTWPYMAPEQLEGLPDFASDQWALAVLAFELVTGKVPFPGTSLKQLEKEHRLGPFAKPRQLRPDLSQAAEQVILRALSVDPRDRYPSIHEMGQAFLRAVIETEIGPPEIDPPSPRPNPAPDGRQPRRVGHVLTIGLADHSVSDHERRNALTALFRLALGTPTFRKSAEVISTELEESVTLIFADFLEAIHCAIDVSEAAKDAAALKVRMGIHSGLIELAESSNEQIFQGEGISGSKAVMHLGDAGQILITQATVDYLAGLERQWLQDLGEHKVTAELVIRLYNLYTGKGGVPRWPSKLPQRQLSLPEVLRQCRKTFESLDEFLTPESLRIVFRAEKLKNYYECVPRSTDLKLDPFIDCLHQRGRTYKGEALIELLDELVTIYAQKADYREAELATLKRNLTSVLVKK